MSRTRVLLVDDHAMLRSGMRLLISGHSDLHVVGEAGTLQEAIQIAPQVQPDVITLDLSMPGGSGVAGVQRLFAAAPGAKILVVTMHDDPAYVRSAMAMGAAGFLVKSAADSELISAIRAVASGRAFMSVPTEGTMDDVLAPRTGGRGGPAPIATLSEREREVLVEVARGYTNQQIADRIGLSVKTVESYRARLMHKLGLKDRADLMRIAVDAGMLGDDP